MSDRIISFCLSVLLLIPNTTTMMMPPLYSNPTFNEKYIQSIEEEETPTDNEQLPIEDVQPEVEEPAVDELPSEPEETIKPYNPNTDPSKFTEDDIWLMALVTIAEAECESELGKRLVIDTILNCMDSEQFPNTVYEIVYRKNHFSSMWNGRVDQCVVTEDVIQLVREEIQNRTNYEVMFFRTKHYHTFGTPIMQVGNHWFSGL